MQHQIANTSLSDIFLALAPAIIVLDVESRPLDRDDPIQRLVSNARDQIVLNTITAASILVAKAEPADVSVMSLVGNESEILVELDALLTQHIGHVLLTFNGARFDVPLLQMRALHHGLVRLAGIGGLAHRPHLDLMRAIGCRCSLEALAAALNLTNDAPVKGADPVDKCRSDVIHTYLCATYLAGFQSGNLGVIGRALACQDWLADLQC